jgi:hypothetical protein
LDRAYRRPVYIKTGNKVPRRASAPRRAREEITALAKQPNDNEATAQPQPTRTALTHKQLQVAKVLASGKAESITHAAELAKVDRNTVYRVQRSATGQREIERLERRRSDRARRLRDLSGDVIEQRLANDPSDQLALGAFKVATDAIATGVDEGSTEVSDGDRERHRAWVRRGLVLAYRAGQRSMRPQDVVLSPSHNALDAEIVNERNNDK